MSRNSSEVIADSAQHPLAIVGIGCRLPGGVDDARSFWELLINGQSGIVEVPADRWNLDRYYHEDRSIPGRMITKWGGFVKDLDQFDPGFWGISPREASRMDPQQRWLLEVSWEAIEDAGIPPSRLRGTNTGVFVGIASNDYAGLQMPNYAQTDVHTNSGCTLSIASNRISYMLDLKGPSMSVDTACSSALVAMTQACQAIWNGDCDAVLTGGVNALITPHATIGFSKASMLSPSGQCFAFDDRADGYVRGEGAAMVLIKRLDQAMADGDPIYSVVRAAVVNQDGHTSSMTVPSVEGQSAMLRQAYNNAGIEPGRVAYMEAHGTGTQVGDPIEATALGNVLGQGRPAGEKCLIGSVKTNIGHLESGSGVAGLLKATMVLHHGTIPTNLNFETPNPNIPFERLRLQVVNQTQPLPRNSDAPPIAAVNSFGFGGTNAHIVLQAAPEPLSSASKIAQRSADPQSNGVASNGSHLAAHTHAADRPCLLPISARDEESLRNYAASYANFLKSSHSSSTDVREVCYSAGERKEHHPLRLVVTGNTSEEMQEQIATWLNSDSDDETAGVYRGNADEAVGSPTFVFTGQGAQWWKMGRDLFLSEPLFQRTLRQIDQLFQPLAGWSLIDEMMNPASEEDSKILRTNVAQPAIFALQVALAELWKSWGVTPGKVIGHSVGEVAAAYVAGAYSLEDAVKIIYHRSRLQDIAGGDGRMVAAGISAAEARMAIGDLNDQVQVAVINSPSLVTLAGDREPLEQIVNKLEQEGKFVRWLRINYAFHTHHMDPIKDDLLDALADIQPRKTTVPYISTVTGTVLPGNKLDGEYWWRNVRQPVLFAPAISGLVTAGERFFLELGPHPALASAINEILAEQGKQGGVFHSLKRKTDETQQMLMNVADLYFHGATIDWKAINQSRGELVRLPRYPWRHERYWLESPQMEAERLGSDSHPLLGQRQVAAMPTWQFQADPRLLSYVRDHVIWDGIIFPGAGYGEIGLALARQLFPDDSYVVEDLEIEKAMFLSDDKVPTVQVVFDDSDKSFKISSSTNGEHWDVNAKGRLVQFTQSHEPSPADLDTIKSHLPIEYSHEAYYADFDEAGFQFGPDFSQIQTIWRQSGEALGQIRIPQSIAAESINYLLHPAVLDACLQASSGVQNVRENPDEELKMYLPSSIRRIHLFADTIPTELWAHVKNVVDDEVVAVNDIFVYDDNGEPVAEILGFHANRVERSRAGADELENCYYQFQWETVDSVASTEEQTSADAPAAVSQEEPVEDQSESTWIVLADTQGIAPQLAEQLRNRGARVIEVTRGEKFAINGERATINARREDDFRQLLSANVLGENAVAGIVSLWCLDHGDAATMNPERLLEEQQTGVLTALQLQHVLAELDWPRPPRVYLVTRDLHPVIDGDSTNAVADAPLVGFVRVANNEHPANKWTMIDLAKQSTVDDANMIFNEVNEDDDEYEVAFRNGQRYVNRLRRVKVDDLPNRTIVDRSSDGSKIPYRLETVKPGVLTNLTLNETRRRTPNADEIEVEIKAGGINFRDVMKALGMYPGNPIDLLWFGDDFSGVVTRVGENIRDLKVGDEVAGMAPYSFRAYNTVNRHMVFPKARQLSFEEAATLPTVFLTAHYCLNELARLQSGEKVLIHAGTGGVGQAAIQIAKRIGLEIFSTAGTPEKRAMLKEMGVHHVMNSRTVEFADQIMDITEGRGVDAVLNSLAGEFIPKSFSVLAPFGRFLEIGKIDVYGNSKLGLQALKDNISYFVIDLAEHLQHKPAYVASMFAELAERFAAGDYQPLTHKVFPISDVVEAFRYMAQGKHIGKNVLSFDVDQLKIGPCTEPEHLLREDATYLITGGAGGMGLELAQWMVSHGARHLALMSRSGPKDDAIETIAKMRAEGIEVLDARGDVTNLADVQRVVNNIQADMPQLRGVVHGAVVLDDQFIADLDKERFNRVLNPKMVGAWNLHLATLDLPIEHFISFSSFSNVIGGTKQSNYNAGNSFLDFLAHYRHGLGLPALTVNWGALQGAGILTRDEKTAEYLDKLGMKAFNVSETLSVVGQMLTLDPIQVGASRMTWPSVARLSPLVAKSNTYAELTQESKESGGGSIRAQIMVAAPEARSLLVEEFLAEQVASVFGVTADKVDHETPLTKLGLDSLMSIDLMNRVETEFGASVPMGAVLRGPNLKELAEILLDTIGDTSAAGDGDSGDSVGESTALVPLEATTETDGVFPLTEGQQALWFLYRLAPTSSAYNLTFSSKFSPHLEIEPMKEAFASLFAQHPMLDVTFSDATGDPLQRVRQGGTIDFREHDASNLSEDEVKTLLIEHANRPFDLENGPVCRLELFRTEDSHIALMCMHHIISDAWSVTVLFKDLVEGYFTLKAGRQPQYESQPYSYEDFVAWQRRHLASEASTRMREHWLTHLKGVPETINLPTDHPRPPVQSFKGSTFGFTLDDDLSQQVLQLAAEQNVTLFTLLLSAYEALLHRYTRQDDFVVGVPLAGRNHRELHHSVGYYVNPVPMRSHVDDDPTFIEFLGRNTGYVAGALENQQYPLKRLVHEMDVARDPSRSPLFQVAFSMERIPGFDEVGLAVFLIGKGGHKFHLGELTMETVDLTLRQAQFEILLVVEEAGGTIYGCWQYNRDLFDAETIERLSEMYTDVLNQLVRNPMQRISELAVAANDEFDDLSTKISQWNRTETSLDHNVPVHQLIERQAARTPDAVAVVHNGNRLTYAALNERANRLAHLLKTQGVTAGTRVGVCMHRDVDLIVAILGILKAGGAYVPLDANYPQQRLELIAGSAEMSVVVTHEEHRQRLGNNCGKLICLDADKETIAEQSSENPPLTSGLDDLMYVIFTSGSTGTPKGAGVYHRGFTNLVQWFVREFGIDANDRSLVITSHGFDLTQKNLYAALMVGGQVHLTGTRDYDPDQILREIDEQKITLLNCTPSTFYPLVDDPASSRLAKLDSLKTVFLGGESIDMKKLADWRERPGFATEITNTYGPTECTDICSFYRVGPDSNEETFPIGYPIYNVKIYVLDRHQQLLPVGATGELCITGAGVGAGYINDDELTKQKFVRNPFDSGNLMYRTGDLCRYRQDGAIEFVGRVDDQVKIRGFRIELGEIESAIRKHEAVAEAVVVAREVGQSRQQLVAYTVAADMASVSISDLKDHLLESLPDYMVPAYFVSVDELPLTPHGKVDRQALPAPDSDEIVTASSNRYVAPRDELETELVELWKTVLGVEKIGVLDGFFELGGDSLSSVHLMTLIRKTCGVEMPLAVLLQGDSAAQVASWLRQRPESEHWSPMVIIQPHGSRAPLFLIHPVGGNVLCYSDLAGQLGEDQPVYGIQARGVDSSSLPTSSMDEMVEEYLAALRDVQPSGPYHLAAWSSGGVVAYEMARQLQLAGDDVNVVAMFDSFAPSLLEFDAEDEAMIMTELVGFLNRFYHLGVEVTYDDLQNLNSEQRLKLLTSKVQQVGFLPFEVDQAYVRRFVDVCQANLRAIANYQPPKTDLPVVLFRADDPRGRSSTANDESEDLGWGELVGECLQVESMPGNHVTMMTGPQAKGLARQLRERMVESPQIAGKR